MTTTRGLEGIVATQSSVSSIIDDELTYHGYGIDDLAENASFEEVVYLLWNGELPTKEELESFSKALAEQAAVPDEIFEQMKAYPIDSVHPMAALRTSVSMLGLFDDEAESVEEEKITAKRLNFKQKFLQLLPALSGSVLAKNRLLQTRSYRLQQISYTC